MHPSGLVCLGATPHCVAQGGLPRAGITGVWPTALQSSGVREAQSVESAVLISQTELLGTFSSEGGGELERECLGVVVFLHALRPDQPAATSDKCGLKGLHGGV